MNDKDQHRARSAPLSRPSEGGVGEGRGEGSSSSGPPSPISSSSSPSPHPKPTSAAQNNAARLRVNESPPERVLWSKLRNRQLANLKFRRQHPIGPYIADFYCNEIRLVIELDSRFHNNRLERDAARDAWMNQHGINVLRITAAELASNEAGVLSTIRRLAEDLRAKPGGGGEIEEKKA